MAKRPPDFSLVDTSDWDARRFLREFASRQGKHAWEQDRSEWETPMPASLLQTPIINPDANLVPVSDPDEVDRFLARPPTVFQTTSKERANHALDVGMIAILVDPNAPNLEQQVNIEIGSIRAQHPLPKTRGRPSVSTDVFGIDAQKVEQWRAHRIIDLYDLIIKGHDPGKERQQLAWWLFKDVFPNTTDRRARGKKLDRAVDLLDEALAMLPMINAQTRKARDDLLAHVAGVIAKQLGGLDRRPQLNSRHE
jgi:hypothetical protein